MKFTSQRQPRGVVGGDAMIIKLTYAELLALKPCNAEARKALFGRRKYLTFPLALKAGVSISDLLWVAGKLDMKRECVRFALACAQRQAHNNPDPRVKAALDATQAWLDVPSESAASAAWGAAWSAERSAAWGAAWSAERSAASAERSAERSAAESAASAARSAAASAAWGAAWSAERSAASAERSAERSAEQEAQRALFLEIFGGDKP